MIKYFTFMFVMFINILNAEQTDTKYFTYNDFLKIKSSFNENECKGVEYFLQSSKNLDFSDKWYIRANNGSETVHEIKNLPYENLCLITRSTEFEANGEIKDATVKFKKNINYWENNFPKNKKIVSLVFKTPMEMRQKCTVPEYQSSAYYIIYYKENEKVKRKIYFNSNAEQGCIDNQLQSLINNYSTEGTLIHTVQNNKNYYIVHDTMEKNSKEIDQIPSNQKILIIGTINGSTFIYYNKKNKDICEPLEKDCSRGWIDTRVIVTND